ncbi:MAG: hypothetical protein UT90_C0018G0004 [Parcubacteria group bacterium GW2011_GWA1_40_21]|nr:MAG: hypothetical protein UT90_C0018G0004 [Parcubacteria group bacterium GW2011_GWA1_40_21]
MQNFTPPPRAPAVLVKARESYSLWFKIIADFPKIYRQNLGGKIEGYFLELLENIFVSLYLSGDQKLRRLVICISKLDGVKFFLQLAWENKCIPNEKYTALSAHLDEVGRMLGGWKKGLEAKTPPRQPRGETLSCGATKRRL